jgi:hypothetical protein
MTVLPEHLGGFTLSSFTRCALTCGDKTPGSHRMVTSRVMAKSPSSS